MTAPTYTVSGSVIFDREHRPLTLERAFHIKAIHGFNASFWLSQGTIPAAKRIELAQAEQSLAEEMAEAIRAVNQPEQKEAA